MKRVTQNLFEEIQKITSGSLEEKLKHDEDGDGDEDAADYMMKRRKAGGQSHAQAHAATRKHNEETEQEGEELEEEIEELDELSKSTLGSYVKKRVKQVPKIEVAYQMAPDEGGPFGAKRIKKYQKKVNKGISSAVDRLTKEDVDQVEEAWPGTPEHKAKHGSDYEKHMMKYGGDPKAARATKGRYGYEGASGSETPETAADSSKVGRGRKKMKEETTIIKHEDFIISMQENYSFKDYLNAAKSYADNESDAITVAESFFKDEDTSLVLENEIKYLYQSVLDEYRKEGNEVTEMEINIDGEDAEVSYTVTESDTITNYIHQGKIVRGEQ